VSSLIVQNFIDSTNSKYDHPYSDQDILDFINELEQSIYTETLKDFQSVYIPLIANQHQYAFPSGATILSMEALFVSGVELPKRDLRQKNTRGYYTEQNKLTLYPCPSQSDTSYVSEAGEITFASSYIETSGDDFTGIAVGDIVLVSGATTAANNRYAVATKVEAKKLTFTDGAFTDGADAAAVTISIPSLEVVCRVRPAVKILDNADTDTLALPDAFTDAYRYYVQGQICLLQKEFTEGENWLKLFNGRVKDFAIWYMNNKPKMHISYKRRW
jgi:uncharacterized protein with FMN-binding domain